MYICTYLCIYTYIRQIIQLWLLGAYVNNKSTFLPFNIFLAMFMFLFVNLSKCLFPSVSFVYFGNLYFLLTADQVGGGGGGWG